MLRISPLAAWLLSRATRRHGAQLALAPLLLGHVVQPAPPPLHYRAPLQRSLPARSPRRANALGTIAVLTAIPLAPAALPAQGKPGWNGRGELSASLFFGNTQQMVATTHAEVSHTDSLLAVQVGAQYTYGRATDATQHAFVSKRSWRISTTATRQPFARVSPFALAAVESSLEQRIDMRYQGGLGAKVAVVHDTATTLDLSLAMIAERSFYPDSVQSPGAVARSSARVRLRHDLNDHLSLHSETTYNPEITIPGHFTLSSDNSIAYRFSKLASLTVSLLENYDSQARSRGARSNNDGQLVMGILVAR